MGSIPVQKRKFQVTFHEKVLGTAPLNEEIYKDWIASRTPVLEHSEEEVEMITEEKGMTGFLRDADGIYIMNYMVKGFLKEAANNLKEVVENPNQPDPVQEIDGAPVVTVNGKKKPAKNGVTNLRSKIDNYVFIRPRHLWLKETHDGVYERPIRVMTAKGPRVSLTASHYVDAGTQIEFWIELIKHKELGWDLIETLMNYGEYKGIGQWRNADFGSFEWKEIANGNGNGNGTAM